MVPVEKLLDAPGIDHTNPDTLKQQIEEGDLKSFVEEQSGHGNVVGFDFSHIPGKARAFVAKHPWQIAAGAAVVSGAIYIWEHRKQKDEENRRKQAQEFGDRMSGSKDN